MTASSMPMLRRTGATAAPDTADTLPFRLNGQPCAARPGDTLLTAILLHSDRLRISPFSQAPRAGFCLMGACQDCWVQCTDGRRLRACSTLVEAGMDLLCPLTDGDSAARENTP